MMTTVGLIWGEEVSGGDTSERRDRSGTNGRMRVRKPLGKERKAQKEPELRRTPWRGRRCTLEREG